MKWFNPSEPRGGEPIRVSETGDAAAASGGFANSGYINQVVLPPRPMPSWPHQVGVVPSRAASFQPRLASEVLRSVVDDPRAVLAGTGGVGKTQIAAEYARNALQQGEVDFLLWITADNRTAVASGYAHAATELLGRDFADSEVAAAALLAWLAPRPGQAERRWLIVLDDLQDPADLSGLWPPESPCGRTLVTTRRRDAAVRGSSRGPVEVGVFSADEARSYLEASLAVHERPESDGQVDALAEDLGRLPLALSQAVAYLVDVGIPVCEYRALLADRARRLGEVLPDLSGLPDQQRHTVAAAWELSVERADTLAPTGLARPMLHLASVLDPNGIPATVLTGESAVAWLGRARQAAGATGRPVDAHDARAALRVLHRMSLLDHVAADGRGAIEHIRVHKLIQRACLERSEAQDRRDAVLFAAMAAAESWPEHGRDLPLEQLLRANAAALRKAEPEMVWATDAHNLLVLAGDSLAHSGHFRAAADYFRQVHAEASRYLGPGAQVTLAALVRAATWQRHGGDPSGAARTLDRILPELRDAFGAESDEVRSVRINRARYIGDAGHLADAVAELEAILAEAPTPGGADRDDGVARMIHARLKAEAGDLEAALEILQVVLREQTRSLGADHPGTLTTRDGIANLLGETGRVDDAVAEYRLLVAARATALGEDHPDTRTARGALARWLTRSGHATEAITLLEGLLADTLRLGLPTDEPEVMTDRHNLSLAWAEAGDSSRALRIMQEVLADRLGVLGPEHPDTFLSRQVLAHLRSSAGDPSGAVHDLEELLAVQSRILGPQHPDVLTTRNNLAVCRAEAGSSAGTIEELATLRADAERILGPRHPLTVTIGSNSAFWQAHVDGSRNSAAER